MWCWNSGKEPQLCSICFGSSVNLHATFSLPSLVFFSFFISLSLFSVFLYTSPALLAFIFVGWGLALVSMSFLLASLVSSRRVATVLGYVIALFGNLIALVLCDGIYGNLPPFSLASVLPKPFYAFPLFGLVSLATAAARTLLAVLEPACLPCCPLGSLHLPHELCMHCPQAVLCYHGLH